MALTFRNVSATAVVVSIASTFLLHTQPSRSSFLRTLTVVWPLAVTAWGVWIVFLWPRIFSPLCALPEPAGGHWLYGHFIPIRDQPSGRPITKWTSELPHDGLFRYRFLLNQERVVVTSPKALAEVLVTRNYEFGKPSTMRSFLSTILGVGVLIAEGEEHKMQRKNLMPAFAFRHVKDLYPVFWSKAVDGIRVMTEEVRADADASASFSSGPATAVMEANSWASRVTLDIIGVAGLGRDFGVIRNPDNALANTYRGLFKPSKQGQLLGLLAQFVPNSLVRMIPVQRNNDVMAAAATIRSVCRDLVLEKRQKLARKEPSDPDILSVAMESGGFTDENLVDQMMTFLAAGHETTASAMTWAVYLLCLHPEVQSRLREEIHSQLPSPGASSDPIPSITALDIDHMPYLNAVCLEILRFFSPVPLTFREASIDTTLNGQKIPKGTRIVLPVSSVNVNPALWGEDAEVFNPDRWLATPGGGNGQFGADGKPTVTASGGASSNYAFMTFLHGPRSCIGSGFAKAEFACILAVWIGRFEFRLKNEEEYDMEKMEIKGGITSRPANGLYVHATVVEDW